LKKSKEVGDERRGDRNERGKKIIRRRGEEVRR
jgi:hypothetical protein